MLLLQILCCGALAILILGMLSVLFYDPYPEAPKDDPNDPWDED
jgi:hypothetical protein